MVSSSTEGRKLSIEIQKLESGRRSRTRIRIGPSTRVLTEQRWLATEPAQTGISFFDRHQNEVSGIIYQLRPINDDFAGVYRISISSEFGVLSASSLGSSTNFLLRMVSGRPQPISPRTCSSYIRRQINLRCHLQPSKVRTCCQRNPREGFCENGTSIMTLSLVALIWCSGGKGQ